MNKEIAKQLKDAGFIQKNMSDDEKGGEYDYDGLYFPTLSELIEACKLDSFALGRDRYGGAYSGGEWICGNNHVIEESWKDDDTAYNFWKDSEETTVTSGYKEKYKASGKTPEDAIAKLWLKLKVAEVIS